MLVSPDAVKEKLLSFAHGTIFLVGKTNVKAFVEQEKEINPLAGFLYDITATHPRITRRIMDIDKYFNKNN